MTFATALAVGGAVLGAAGAIGEGIANKRAADYQAKVAEFNRQVAEFQAGRATQRGQIDQQELDFENLALLGTQMATQGASGVSINSRSARQVRDTTRRLARLDALRVREGAQQEAFSYRVQAAGFRSDAEMSRRAGRGALVAGFLGAGRSLVTGAARVGRVASAPTGQQFRTLMESYA